MAELDLSVKGKEVTRHFALTVAPDAAVAIRRVVAELREACAKDPGWFGLREDEDEALEALVEALNSENDEDDDTPGQMVLA